MYSLSKKKHNIVSFFPLGNTDLLSQQKLCSSSNYENKANPNELGFYTH